MRAPAWVLLVGALAWPFVRAFDPTPVFARVLVSGFVAMLAASLVLSVGTMAIRRRRRRPGRDLV